MRIDRRTFSSLLGLCLFAGCVSDQAPGEWETPAGFTRIAPGTYLLRGEFVAGRQPDGNSLVLAGADGLVVFDTGRHEAHTHRLLDFSRVAALPVTDIVNSHWHLDHVSGNAPLRDAFPQARVHASLAIEPAMRGFLAGYRSQLQQMLAQPADDAQAAEWREEIARIDHGARLFPTDAVRDRQWRQLAGRRLRLGLVRGAVSGGDVWMLDPRTRVLAAGDLVTLPAPLFDTACPSHWSDALGELDAQDFHLLVPGHGVPMSRKQFQIYRMAFDNLLACAAAEAGRDCTSGWLTDAAELVPAQDRALAESLLGYYLQTRLAPESVVQACAGTAD